MLLMQLCPWNRPQRNLLLTGPVTVQELLAGGAAGGFAKTVVAPLERVKILFQVSAAPGLRKTMMARLFPCMFCRQCNQ